MLQHTNKSLALALNNVINAFCSVVFVRLYKCLENGGQLLVPFLVVLNVEVNKVSLCIVKKKTYLHYVLGFCLKHE